MASTKLRHGSGGTYSSKTEYARCSGGCRTARTHGSDICIAKRSNRPPQCLLRNTFQDHACFEFLPTGAFDSDALHCGSLWWRRCGMLHSGGTRSPSGAFHIVATKETRSAMHQNQMRVSLVATMWNAPFGWNAEPECRLLSNRAPRSTRME